MPSANHNSNAAGGSPNYLSPASAARSISSANSRRPLSFWEIIGSLHFRLTLWYSVVTLLVVVASLGAVRESVRLTLLGEIDDTLREEALEVATTVEEFYPDFERIGHELNRKAQTHEHSDMFIRLVDRTDAVVFQTSTMPSAISGRPPLALQPDRPQTISNYRLIRHDTKKADVPRHSIQVGVSTTYVARDVAEIERILATIGVAVLLITPIGGYWLAGRATRPLARIIDITARLHPTNLDERLHLRGTRDELDRLSQTINGLLDRIAAYITQMRQFTADAAHELRSPMAAMQSSLDVALTIDRTPEEYKEILAQTLEECASLRDLVNKLLTLAETDAGRITKPAQPTELDKIVSRSCEMFAAVAETRDVRLNLAKLEPANVYGDAARLRQVITNLIDNAIKFTPQAGTVTVELTADPHRGEAQLRVCDTGVGIVATDLPHIFERFYRADKARQRGDKSTGSGLGLSICESIVSAYHGTIRADSYPGRGTTIFVTLPLAQTSQNGQAENPVASLTG
ncbi:MAG: HAMP domain-containing protein [Planctomycetes bacterium]|nr:HAMP domain-containing protein [Planctomycetota bacterium]